MSVVCIYRGTTSPRRKAIKRRGNEDIGYNKSLGGKRGSLFNMVDENENLIVQMPGERVIAVNKKKKNATKCDCSIRESSLATIS